MKKTVFPTNLRDRVFAEAQSVNELCQRNNNYIKNYGNTSPKDSCHYINRLMAALLPLFKYNFEEFNFQRALDYLGVSINKILTPECKLRKESKIGLLKNAVSIFTLTSEMLKKLEPNKELEVLRKIYRNQAKGYMKILQHFDAGAEDIVLSTMIHLGELSRHKAYTEPFRLIIQEQIIQLNNEYSVENIPKERNRPLFWKNHPEPNIFGIGNETDSLLISRKSPSP